MKCATVFLVAALVGGAAHGADCASCPDCLVVADPTAPGGTRCQHPPVPWQFVAEAGVNSDDNIEAELGLDAGRWTLGVRARDAAYATATGLTCRTFLCRTGTAEELEYDASVGYIFSPRGESAHGPVLHYTKRAGDFDTWYGGYRVVIAGGGK